MKTTTLALLREYDACERGYDLIASVSAEDEAIPLLKILDNNGLTDCIWALRATPGGAEVAEEFAIRCALVVAEDASWRAWAEGWLSGADRSRVSAAASAASVAARAASAYAASAYAARAASAYAARAAYVYAARAARAYAADASAAASYASVRAAQADTLRNILTREI